MSKLLAIILIILSLALGAAAGYLAGYDHGWENRTAGIEVTPENTGRNPEPTVPISPTGNQRPDPAQVPFQNHKDFGFFGTLTLTGYLKTEKRVCNPGDMCGETVDYASFVFANSQNSALNEFLGINEGNSFAGKNLVGLGCYQKDKQQIYYINFADELGDSGRPTASKEGSIAGNDLAKLLASTQARPVELKLTRPIYTSGQGAPDCYSHFRDFDVQ